MCSTCLPQTTSKCTSGTLKAPRSTSTLAPTPRSSRARCSSYPLGRLGQRTPSQSCRNGRGCRGAKAKTRGLLSDGTGTQGQLGARRSVVIRLHRCSSSLHNLFHPRDMIDACVGRCGPLLRRRSLWCRFERGLGGLRGLRFRCGLGSEARARLLGPLRWQTRRHLFKVCRHTPRGWGHPEDCRRLTWTGFRENSSRR